MKKYTGEDYMNSLLYKVLKNISIEELRRQSMRIDWEGYKKWYAEKYPEYRYYSSLDETKMKLGSSYEDPEEGLMFQFEADGIGGWIPARFILVYG